MIEHSPQILASKENKTPQILATKAMLGAGQVESEKGTPLTYSSLCFQRASAQQHNTSKALEPSPETTQFPKRLFN